MTRPRAGLLLLLLLAVSAAAFPQGRLTVRFPSRPGSPSPVRSFVSEGHLYASLSDLAAALGLGTYENRAAGKFELKTGIFAVKLTADNPYVIVRDRDLNASVHQLPVPALRSEGDYFVPAGPICAILDAIVPDGVSFDAAAPAIVAGGSPRAASPYDVADLELEEKANGYLIRLRCTRRLSDYESWVKEMGEDSWLYVTLANARADVKRLNAIRPTGILRQVLVFQSATSVQLTFRIRGKVSAAELLPAERGDDILVSVHMPSEAELAARKARPFDQTLEREKERWKLDVVVIDAGHGGSDPGTIGVNNTREKDVALSIAKKLGNLIRKHHPDVKVVYTREDDRFIELYRRGQIANSNNGKLFISIHCNSMPRKPHPTNGFEIYLLRPGKTEAAIRVAEKENAVVKLEEGYEKRYKELTEENFILLSMAQSSYVKYSEMFAEILQQEMGKKLQLENNGVRQAGFIVLWGASMPNVLVETGYLSNRKDERFLRSESGQREIAESLLSAITRYKAEYEKTIGAGDGAGGR